MEATVKFLEKLVEEMNEDVEFWGIESVEEFEEVTENSHKYAKLSDGSKYEKQGDIYIKQWTGHTGDDYHGVIIKPITNKKALKISYQC